MQNNILLKWWIQTVVVMFAAVMAGHLGWWEALWYADQTKISVVIIAVYIFATGLCGIIAKKRDTTFLDRQGDYVWFSVDAMLTLGMIGTVAGFLMLFGDAFVNIDVENTENLQAVIVDMAVGIGTALTTTLMGLIGYLLTKLQIQIIESSWDEDDDEVSTE